MIPRLSLAATLALSVLAPPALADVGPVTPSGATLYEASCAKCHGADGKGGTKIGEKLRGEGKRMPDLTVSKLDDKATRAAIADGIAGTAMKGYASKMTADEIDAVTRYTKSLRR
jgi:mono/diheme cytochrome c family protein